MPRLPDLVQDSKLETRFHSDGRTEHIFTETGLTAHQRTIHREEVWVRKRDIAVGGYGFVWQEECVAGGANAASLRAVKRIPKGMRASRPIDYNRELEAIAKFSHPKYRRCFVQSFGWYEDPESIFIAMEYFGLGDLHDCLADMPPLRASEAGHITFQILEGVFDLHENDFAHRDLKPRNIFVKSKPPEPWWVKIGDFGISKRLEDGMALQSTVRGTLGFMAPELLGYFEANSSHCPQPADIWSVEEITFQMLTRRPMFQNLAQLNNYIQRPQTFPSSSLLGLDETGVDFIRSLMVPEPHKRLTATAALSHDWLSHYKLTTARPSTGFVHSSPAVRNTQTQANFPPDNPSNTWSTDVGSNLELPIRLLSTTLDLSSPPDDIDSSSGAPLTPAHETSIVDPTTSSNLPVPEITSRPRQSSPNLAPSNSHNTSISSPSIGTRDEEFEIMVKGLGGGLRSYCIDNKTTCLQLKHMIQDEEGTTMNSQYLFSMTTMRWIPEREVLSAHGITKGSRIEVLLPIWVHRLYYR